MRIVTPQIAMLHSSPRLFGYAQHWPKSNRQRIEFPLYSSIFWKLRVAATLHRNTVS